MAYSIRRFRAEKTTIYLSAGYAKIYSDFFQGAPGMAERANFELFRNTDVVLRFQLTTPEPYPTYVSGWTTEFVIRTEENANAIITVAGTLSNLPNALQYGIFDVALSAANTALLTDKAIYDWSFRRTDSGYADVLALGEVRAFTAS
jgi:hypothetical protein